MTHEELIHEYGRAIMKYLGENGPYGKIIELQNKILERMKKGDEVEEKLKQIAEIRGKIIKAVEPILPLPYDMDKFEHWNE